MSSSSASEIARSRSAAVALARTSTTPHSRSSARARVDGRELDGVRILALGVDLDDALLLEKPLDRPRLAQLPAATRERRADLGHGAVPVIRGGLDHHGDAARRVALVDDALECRA